MAGTALHSFVHVIAYGLLNIISAVLIVVANKVVLYTYQFSFPVALTWLHTIVTAVGLQLMALLGMFTMKRLPWAAIAPNAVAYVAYIVFNNMSIQLNTLSFYQISKICITPAVVVIEFIAYGKLVSRHKLMAVSLLMFGIAVATISDKQVASNPVGILMAVLAVLSSALCQVWAGAKQQELKATGDQLLHQLAPTAVALLAVMVPMLEPVGLTTAAPGTILGFQYTASAMAWILVSSCLGLLVTLSSYLFIAATSPLTFNVMGHLKTILIVTAGMVFFQDVLTPKKCLGLLCAMAGIVWYSMSGLAAKSIEVSSSQVVDHTAEAKLHDTPHKNCGHEGDGGSCAICLVKVHGANAC